MKQNEKKRDWLNIEYRRVQNKKLVVTVYVLLRLSVVGMLVAQIFNGNFENVYTCILALILFTIPSLIERRLHIDLPDTLEIIILLFIYAAEILGEIQEYYVLIPFWDDILHTLNGFLFAAVGFSLVNILNRDKRVMLRLSPFYMAVMAFCFSMTIGVLWEFFEWGVDTLMAKDMQKDTIVQAIHSVTLHPEGRNIPVHIQDIADVILVHSDGSQTPLGVGGYLDIGLIDTMSDLLVNFIGAVVFSFIGFFLREVSGQREAGQPVYSPADGEAEPGKAGGIVMDALCQKQFLQLAPPQRQIRGRRSSGFWMPCPVPGQCADGPACDEEAARGAPGCTVAGDGHPGLDRPVLGGGRSCPPATRQTGIMAFAWTWGAPQSACDW